MTGWNIDAKPKRLTPTMIKVLMECHERELLNQEPCDIGTTNYVQGLLRRGFLQAKMFINSRGKKIMGLYITDAGKKYLDLL